MVTSFGITYLTMTPDTGLASHYCVPQDMDALKCVCGLEGLSPTDLLVSRRPLSMPTVIDDRFRMTCTVIRDRWL